MAPTCLFGRGGFVGRRGWFLKRVERASKTFRGDPAAIFAPPKLGYLRRGGGFYSLCISAHSRWNRHESFALWKMPPYQAGGSFYFNEESQGPISAYYSKLRRTIKMLWGGFSNTQIARRYKISLQLVFYREIVVVRF